MSRLISALAVFCAVTVAALPAQEAKDINAPFANPDVPAFIQRFENDSREVYAQRGAVADALGLKPGMAVADVGAGTGFYALLFARRVGPEGKVYAVEIAPAFLKHIEEQARKQGLDGIIRTVRGSQDGTNLPDSAIDLVFVCDTYHHFEHPERVLATIHRALKPGGRLVVIDMDKHDGASEFIKKHIRAEKEVFFREIAAAGFEKIDVPNPPRFKENFFAAFRKRDRPVPAPR